MSNYAILSDERAMEAFWTRVSRGDGCWAWTGYISAKGYGRFHGHGAHRIAFQALVGPIPEGLTLDHLCRNRACCNPDHLEPVTVRENTLRGVGRSAINARKTHCIRGHEFTPENTINNNGRRNCRACKRRSSRIAERKRTHRRRAKAALAKGPA